MSDDIFKDIWQKLADIYRQLNAAVAVAKAGSPATGAASGSPGLLGRLAGVAGSVAQRVQATFAKIPVVFLKFAGIVSIVTAAMTALVKVVDSLVRSQLEQQRELSKFNAVLAKSFALSDIKDFFRDMKKARGTQQSTVALNNAFTKFKDALLPIQTAWTNLVNKVLTALTKVLTPIINLLSRLVTPLLNGISKLVDLPENIYYAVVDAFKTEAQAKKDQADRARQKIADQHGDQMPVAQMFRSMLRQDWAAVTDSRAPLF